MLYVYGDSHANFNMTGYSLPHVLLHTNSITMHRVGRDREILRCNPLDVQPSDTCLFFYGEVDCRCHIGRQLALGRELDNIVEQLVGSYVDAISHLFLTHLTHLIHPSIIIGFITPPVRKEDHEARHGPITHDFPMIGTDQERAHFTQRMNEALRVACLARRYVFLDLTSLYADEEGMLYIEKSDYNCHIVDNHAIHRAIARILAPPVVPPVVTVTIMGGLGNQLFQLAAAYSYAKKEKGALRILHRTDNGSRPFYWDSICHACEPFLVETLPSTLTAWHESLPTMYTPLPPLPDGGIHLHGYFQTSAYHVDKEDIRSLFLSSSWKGMQEYPILEQSHRIIVLHCRQTDYLTHQDIHGPLTMDYYRRAMEQARSWVENPLFLLCGDDVAFWAPLCAELPSTAYYVLEESSDIRTFQLLQQCKHFIMSNSTFIWWCVYLSSAKHVIAPAKWFGPNGPSPFHDIYESTWIQMD